MSEIAKVLATIAIEKLANPDPITRQAHDYHLHVIAVAVEPSGPLQELYFALRAFYELRDSNAFTHPASRALASRVDLAKLADEVSNLMSLPDQLILRKLKKIILEAYRVVAEERRQHGL